ncbi:MAG TPA: prepilin-type N-terminal cleavage/methylation domain-containing protein, partial [Armatimonadota bacterium]|nr:prepilin-type N-terminal cleavage/methylation domain-containing protein [Armatimonadota bacterium]
MKTMRGKHGFSLVELLTVIAIIAILASIIFPVMNAVKNRAKLTQCMTNMANIASALKMYQMDNRKYPDAIGGMAIPGTPMERAKTGLYPEYINSIKGFHCPLSPVTDTSAIVTMNVGGETKHYYAYSSYDVYCPDPAGGTLNYGTFIRYRTHWAADIGDVAFYEPHPPGTNDDLENQKYDYKRQLRFKSPSDDTVVT